MNRNRISKYIFDVKCLVPFKCEVYVTYHNGTIGDHVGQIIQLSIDTDLTVIDMDGVPKFHIKINQDRFPTRLDIHGEIRVINFMSTLASYFIHETKKQSLIAVAANGDIYKAIKNDNVYTADPDTAYITYLKPEKKEAPSCDEQLDVFRTEEQKKMKLCGYKETCFEKCAGSLLGKVICKYLTEKEDGAGNGLIDYCKKFNTPVETYDTKECRDRQKTKNILNQLADKLACNTSCNNIHNFMELFQSIDVHSENFNQCCTMFRHVVNIALKLDEKLRTVDGVAILRSAMDVEIDGSANLSRATIAKSYGSDHSLCEKCRLRNSKTPCAENMFAKKFEYIVHECKYFDTLTADDIAQAIVATENDQSYTLIVKDPVNGNEYTLNITDVDDDGRLIASVAKIIK